MAGWIAGVLFFVSGVRIGSHEHIVCVWYRLVVMTALSKVKTASLTCARIRLQALT